MTEPIDLNPILTRQRALNLQLPPIVSIIGCGGVGAWVAMFLALAGVRELELWDSDEVSLTNLNRLPLGPAYVGYNKAGALKHMLNALVPRCNIMAITENWSPSNTGETIPTWVVAATDSHASRTQIHAWANPSDEAPRCRYLEVSADGEYGGCTDAPALFTSDLELQRGYQSVPVWVGPCVSAAMMACAVILHSDHKPTFNYRLGLTKGQHNDRGELAHNTQTLELQDL